MKLQIKYMKLQISLSFYRKLGEPKNPNPISPKSFKKT